MDFKGDENDLSKILESLEAEIKTTTEALNEIKKDNEDGGVDDKDVAAAAAADPEGSQEKKDEEKEEGGEDDDMDPGKIETIRELIGRIKAIDAEIADLEAPMTPTAKAIFLAQSFNPTGKNDTIKVSLCESVDIFASDPKFSFEDEISPDASSDTQAQGEFSLQTIVLRSAEQLMELVTDPSTNIVDIIDCYRATLNLCAAKSFEKHPENVILVANTFRYLSSRIVHLTIEANEKQNQLFEIALALDGAAAKIVDNEVKTRGKSLCGFFEVNDKNFGNKWDREKITAVETAIHFTILTAEDCTKSWAEVTPDSNELAALVDALLFIVGSETIKKVESMGDISAKESTNVSRVLGLVLPMGPGLRKLCGPKLEKSLPPIWHKLGVMMALMDMNLVRIHEGIDKKEFIEFEQAELISLVEHLFTETDKRANLIERIKREGLK